MAECLDIAAAGPLGAAIFALWLALAFLGWRAGRSYFFGRRYFLITLAAMLAWLVAVFLELASPGAACKIFWAKVSMPAVVLLPTAWLLFVAEYAHGPSARLRGLGRALLWAGPLAAALAVATNNSHGLFYGPETGPVMVGGAMSVDYQHGPLFFVIAGYIYLLLAWALLIALRGIRAARPRQKIFFAGLILVTLAPLPANVFYLLGGFTFGGMDPTPFSFALAMMVMAILLGRDRIEDVDAIARDLLFHNSADPIVVIDAGGRVIGLNPEARRVFLVDPAAPRPAREILPELRLFIDEIIAAGGPDAARPIQLRQRHFDPDIFAMRRPLSPGDRPMGWVLRMNDTTERRFLAAALLAERDFLARLMETSMAGILALDGAGRVAFINAEAERILGISGMAGRGVSIDDPAWDFGLPAETAAGEEEGEAGPLDLRRHFDALMGSDRAAMRDRHITLRRRDDGERRIVSINATLLRSSDMDAKIVISLADVTEQYRTAASLRDAARRSEQANRSKSQFIANMSHEIRTPLNGVLGMAEVLDRMIKDPEQQRMITTIRHSGELLLAILNDVLDMSKIEAGKLELENTAFRPDQLAARIEELYAVGAAEKGLDLEVYYSGRAETPRLGDPHRIMQILQNLVSNAIKFTHEGEVAVTLSCQPGKPLVLEVRDTGIGMTSEQAARVFNAFEQADGSMTRRFGGTGLGMSIVSRLVEHMGGQIELQSRQGVGTRIRVSLPLEEIA